MTEVENSKSGLMEGNVPAQVVSNVKWSAQVSSGIAGEAVGWKQKQNKWSEQCPGGPRWKYHKSGWINEDPSLGRSRG